MNPTTQPPLGLKPWYIATSDRMHDILAAMQRYVQDSREIPGEWITELAALNAIMSTMKEDGEPSPALREGRKAVLIECEERWCEMAAKRLEAEK